MIRMQVQVLLTAPKKDNLTVVFFNAPKDLPQRFALRTNKFVTCMQVALAEQTSCSASLLRSQARYKSCYLKCE